MAKPYKKNRISTFATISILFIVVVVGCIFGFFAWETEWFSKPFDITTTGGSNTDTDIDINNPDKTDDIPCQNTDAKIEYSTIFGEVNEGDYAIRVIPKITKNNNFDYKVDGIILCFAGIAKDKADFADIFNVKKFENYFTINTTELDIIKILAAVYPDSKITDIGNSQADIFFQIEVTAPDKKVKLIDILFNGYINVSAIELDKGEVIF